jgi:hypothetical protein
VRQEAKEEGEGRGLGKGARRAEARQINSAAIAIPIESIPTSTGVPVRPCTKVWWNSSVQA